MEARSGHTPCEMILVTVDDDDEFDAVADYFDDLFESEIDYDAENKK